MDNLSLYRKYRPYDFDNLVGQDHITSTLINAFKTDHVAHAYLFSGPRGTGKTSSARLIAKALNCTNLRDKYNPCNECEFCKDINVARLIDLIEIDAASNRGIDEIRDLKEKINFAPSRAEYKVYIIDEVHMLTKEAFNALLKTLEEPPQHAYFILATTEIHKIPETIISRCQRFDFRRIKDEDLVKRLKFIAKEEKLKSDDGVFELIGKYSDGCMRDAIGLLEQLVMDGNLKSDRVSEILGICDNGLLESLFKHLLDNNIQEALKIVEDLHSQGSDLKQFLHDFLDYLRGKMLENVNKNDLKMTNTILKIIEIFREAQRHSFSSVPQLSLEIAVVKVGLLFSGIQEIQAVEPVAPAKAIQPPTAPKAQETVPVTTTVPAPEKAVQKSDGSPTTSTSSKESTEQVSVSKVSPESKPEPVNNTESDFQATLETLKENWPRVTERVKTPSLRMSLKNAHISKIDGQDITLTITSKFHHDQVMEHNNRVNLEEIIKSIVNTPVKLLAEIKEMDMKPVMEDEPEPISEPEVPTGDQAINEALDIFGGKVVDDSK